MDAALRDRADTLAWGSLKALTGGMVGGCAVEMRPCLTTEPCLACFGPDWMPHIGPDGEWRNCGRREGTCSCCTLCEIEFPGRVADVLYVQIDGYTIDLRTFRVDNATKLVRQDGYCFPACQNMGAPAGAIGTVVVSYVPGIKPDTSGLWAAGLLACEFVKACTGQKCRLPSRVTSIARQGLSMDMTAGMWEGGTGIREVDAYVHTINPNELKVPSTVWSPDLASAKHRFTTWTAPIPVEP